MTLTPLRHNHMIEVMRLHNFLPILSSLDIAAMWRKLCGRFGGQTNLTVPRVLILLEVVHRGSNPPLRQYLVLFDALFEGGQTGHGTLNYMWMRFMIY
jgi:hypothetical protein